MLEFITFLVTIFALFGIDLSFLTDSLCSILPCSF